VFGMKNQGIVGMTYDSSTDSFNQQFQYGSLTPNRSVISDVVPANNLETVNFINGSNTIFGAYFTDTISPSKLLHFIASVRYNSTVIELGCSDPANPCGLPNDFSSDPVC
jgi:hypothetical protein